MSEVKNIILFDDEGWADFLPLTFTRPTSELRIGILTVKEKWEKRLNAQASYITQEYLQDKYPIEIKEHNYIINGSILPSDKLAHLIESLDHNEAILCGEDLVAAHLDRYQFDHLLEGSSLDELSGMQIKEEDFQKITKLTDIFSLNGQELEADYDLLTMGRKSAPIPNGVITRGDKIFIEEGAVIEHAILNATTGPIYIGKGALVMDGCMVRGGLALCEGSQLKLGSKIYGPTTVGPYSKVGGEVNNSVILGYSNKGHDGFLGNSVIGEWCNLGADTNTSNLKNNYTEVRLWDYATERFKHTGRIFCGLIMGDHSKCGINSMFNTGTVVGVSANVFGEGYPRNFIPSFAWGGKQGMATNTFKKAMEVAKVVMERRRKVLTQQDEEILEKVFESTSKFRSWE